MNRTVDEDEVEAATIRVARGAQWLDENFPGWEGRVDLDTLDLAHGESCICGQVFKPEAMADRSSFLSDGYSYAASNLFAEANSWITAIVKLRADGTAGKRRLTTDERLTRSDRVSIALGFNEGALGRSARVADQVFVEFDTLQKAWTVFLEERTKSNKLAKVGIFSQ